MRIRQVCTGSWCRPASRRDWRDNRAGSCCDPQWRPGPAPASPPLSPSPLSPPSSLPHYTASYPTRSRHQSEGRLRLMAKMGKFESSRTMDKYERLESLVFLTWNFYLKAAVITKNWVKLLTCSTSVDLWCWKIFLNRYLHFLYSRDLIFRLKNLIFHCLIIQIFKFSKNIFIPNNSN